MVDFMLKGEQLAVLASLRVCNIIFVHSFWRFPRHNQDADLDLYSSFVELEWDAYTWAPNFESLGMRLTITNVIIING